MKKRREKHADIKSVIRHTYAEHPIFIMYHSYPHVKKCFSSSIPGCDVRVHQKTVTVTLIL